MLRRCERETEREKWVESRVRMVVRAPRDVLVLGTYERFVIGYEFDSAAAIAGGEGRTENVGESGNMLRRRFCLAAHLGPVQCVSGSSLPAPRTSNIVVSGGADDTIRVIDVYSMKDRGTLVKHEVCA